MRTFRSVLAALLTLILGLSGSAFAHERHAVEPAQIAHAVANRVAQQDIQRAAIREALARPEVARMASGLGIDLAGVAASVDTMGPDALAQAADAAGKVNQSLVGGASTVTISTTTIIIGLLIILLIIVAD